MHVGDFCLDVKQRLNIRKRGQTWSRRAMLIWENGNQNSEKLKIDHQLKKINTVKECKKEMCTWVCISTEWQKLGVWRHKKRSSTTIAERVTTRAINGIPLLGHTGLGEAWPANNPGRKISGLWEHSIKISERLNLKKRITLALK